MSAIQKISSTRVDDPIAALNPIPHVTNESLHAYISETPAPILSSKELNILESEHDEIAQQCANYDRSIAPEFEGKKKRMIDYISETPFFSPRVKGPILNHATLVHLSSHVAYPANQIDFHNISYIQAESPQKLLPGTQRLYYQMAVESGANLLVAATSGYELDPLDPDKYMHFLSPRETIEMDSGTKISCLWEEDWAIDASEDSPSIILRALKICQDGKPDRDMYQIIPTFEPLGHLCPQLQPFEGYKKETPPIPACSQTITEESPSIFDESQKFIHLINTIARQYRIQIDREHPLLVNCIDGNDQSGMFIVLHTLYRDFFSQEPFDHRILTKDPLTQMKGRALHISSESVQHAAISGFDKLFKGLSQQFPEFIDKKRKLHEVIQSEYIKSILNLPRLSDSEKEDIKFGLESDSVSEAEDMRGKPYPEIENESIKDILKSASTNRPENESTISLIKERDYWKARAEELEQQFNMSKRAGKEEDIDKK